MTDAMETLCGRLTFLSGPGSFPLSTDTMVLGDFVKLPGSARVADLGSGSAPLGLLLCARYPDCTVTGIELQRAAHMAALENIARNHLADRLQSIPADLRQVRTLLPAASFHCVVSNPPYFTAGASSAAPAGPQARKELCCTLLDVYQAAAWLLRFGGDFFLVQKPERLTDLLAFGRQTGLEPKQLRFVRHKPHSPQSLVLLRCRRGGKPGLTLLPDLILHHPDGSPTPDYGRVYHLD